MWQELPGYLVTSVRSSAAFHLVVVMCFLAGLPHPFRVKLVDMGCARLQPTSAGILDCELCNSFTTTGDGVQLSLLIRCTAREMGAEGKRHFGAF